MQIIFEATIKVNEIGGWYLQVEDTISKKTQKCNNMEEFSVAIEEMSKEYNGNIDEIKWKVDLDVTSEQIIEVKEKLLANYFQ
ncbi:hypothetical protein CRU99_03130 [Malaciobacter mytili]|uniref:hypothetical protein n=1 Tax=Malaciobacter mytili TaxID=603050 RepID=UPI00100B7420|nr:hypothetical protein [Malaciobacter mytili]RXI46199.1 hypothetical protein CRU99_03130 [Malaciobacter mytili]